MPLEFSPLTMVLDFALKTLLLFLCAAAAVVFLRRGSAALRHRIWCLAFAAAVCLPLLSLVAPRVHWPGLQAVTRTLAADLAEAVLADAVTDELKPSPHPRDNSSFNAAPAPQTTHTLETTAITAAAPSPSTSANWLILWSIGCVLALSPLLCGAIRHRRIVSRARPAENSLWQRELEECRAQLGSKRAVRLFVADEETIPMTWGILRPVVLLPSTCGNWNSQRRRIVLLHELAHIQRFDCAAQLLGRVACALYWFNPLAWYGMHRLRSECERAADDTVVNAGQRAIDYASELVDIAAAYRVPRMSEAACMAGSCQLVERVASMLDPSRSHRQLSRRGTAWSLALASLLLFVIVAIHPVARTAAEEKTEKAPSLKPEQAAEQADRPKTDTLGDPLPDAALLRMGTIRFRHPGSIVDMALSPDDKTVVTADEDFIVWNADTGKELWRVSTKEFGYRLPHASYGVRSMVFAADGQTFYTSGRWDEIVAWDIATGVRNVIVLKDDPPKRQGQLGHYSSISIDMTRDGRMFAYGNNRRLAVCDNTGNVLYEIANNPGDPIVEMGRDRLRAGGDYSYGRFSPDGKILAVVNSESPKEIRIHEAETGKELRRIPVTALLVRLAFSPDSQRIVATERDSAARLYGVATGNKLRDYKLELKNNAESYTCAITFSPDAETIAVCAPIGSDYDIHLLHAADGKRFGKPLEHQWKPWAVAFTADSKMLFSSGWDGMIRRWDVATQKQLTLPGALRATGASAASPDGQSVAFCDETGTVHLYNVADGSEVQQLKVPGSTFSQLVFSPDSRQLAGAGVAGDQLQTTVWDLADGAVVHRWDWPVGRDPHSDFRDLCYSSDGQLLAAAVFRQDSGYFWNLTTGKQVAKLPHQEIFGLSFSPDNRTLATAGWDKLVRFWSTETGEKLREFDVEKIKKPKADHDMRMQSVSYSPQ